MSFYLIINCKTYDESFRENFLRIEDACVECLDFAESKDVKIVICPNILDSAFPKREGLLYFSEHFDDVMPGSHTGHIVVEHLVKLGFSGSLLSHSEDFEEVDRIGEKVDFIKKNYPNFNLCVCARDDETAKKVSAFNPNFIAVESKELIGGDISITSANPDLIKNSLKILGDIPLLVGAGVKNADDVRKAVELGSKGILVASGVVKSNDVKSAIMNLLSGF